MLVLLAGWRKADSCSAPSRVANYALVAGGALLFLMQMHAYSHVANPYKFGFSADDHAHEHLRMSAEAAAQQTHHESLN